MSVLVLSAAGTVPAAWLVWIHLLLKAQPDSGSFCNFGGYFDCDIVNSSRFASVLGVPIAYGALAMYLLLGALAVAELRGSRPPRVMAFARALGALAVAYSVHLAVVSATSLHALCVFCVGLYAVNTGIAALGWWRSAVLRVGVLRVLKADVKSLLGGFRPRLAQLGLLALVAGALALRQLGISIQSEERSAVTVIASGADMRIGPGHDDGPADAPLMVVEFLDFECPYCKRASETVDQLRSEFGGRLRLVLKHYPLDRACNVAVRSGPHRRACRAAEAAVCAGVQGRLWQFQKEVFARGVGDDELEEAAQAVGLDLPAWRQCRWSDRSRNAVKVDIEDGLRVGVRGTPTFLVGDRLIGGKDVLEDLPREIRRQLADRRVSTPTAASRAK